MKASRLSGFLWLTLLACLPLVLADSDLKITMSTSKASYYRDEAVHISGQVTVAGTPLRGVLVAWEVRDENVIIVAVGTSQTDESGFFAFAFRIKPAVNSNAFTARANAAWDGQTTVGSVSFHREFSNTAFSQGDNGATGVMNNIAVLVMVILFGIVLPALLLTSPVFLSAHQNTPQGIASQVLAIGKHRVCRRCGERFLRFQMFCPHCLTYQAKHEINGPL
ncbi:MAG: hypothetical protein JSV58_05500 [Candidatus Bathyarchaeota archaeon]|nr:MAG: hypothetical protein JSV58_05500 [Candidatus Bathyarchaeota archaeon]